MKSSSQPTETNANQYVRLTVAHVREALANCPDDAVIQFKSGGFLAAQRWSSYLDVEIQQDTALRRPIVKTCWE